MFFMGNPITQSEQWQALQEALGEKAVFHQDNSFHFLAIVKSTPVGDYIYCPYGPVAEDKPSFKKALKALSALAKSHKAIFIRIEPQDPKFAQCFPKTSVKTKDLNPKDTWVLNLTNDKAEIISNFSQGTRTRYNTFAKKGLVVEKTKDPTEIKYLVALQNKLFKTKHLNTFSENYLKTELEQPFATLYLVKYQTPTGNEKAQESKHPTPENDQILAASLFFDYCDTRYYMQSAADTEFKKLPATVALLTTALFDAKEQGIKNFDFWGIAPDGAGKDHPWYGFTEFKKSFGGSPRHYAGTYDIVLSPFKYHFYHFLRRIHHLVRKI